MGSKPKVKTPEYEKEANRNAVKMYNIGTELQSGLFGDYMQDLTKETGHREAGSASADIASVAEGGHVLGYTPYQMLHGFNFNAILPDYALAGLPAAAGYILSALAGTALLIIIFKLIGTMCHDTIPSK